VSARIDKLDESDPMGMSFADEALDFALIQWSGGPLLSR
jgi:hypothetical protein